ncbi:MAG: hypothetical protein DRN99_05120 [Thermoproteota archaeon]|nr:MAG: hypothetical protein DRN99_05120 [Candidatus Korarchaeota archaeon]
MRLRLLLLAVLAGVAAGVVLSTVLQEPSEYERRVLELVDEAREAIRSVRGLSVPSGVDVHVVTREWVVETWGKPSASGEEAEAEEAVYKLLLLVGEDFNITELKLKWTGMFVAASLGGDLYVVREYFDPGSSEAFEVVVHELMHVVQGEFFKVPEVESYDERCAISALVEGDAGFTARLCARRGEPAEAVAVEVKASWPEVEGDEDAVIELYMFPYRFGEAFVAELYKAGGWTLVNEAYRRLPVSAEQVMHPGKYLSGEEPAVVSESTWSLGWPVVKRDRMGEYFILVLLLRWLPEEEARAAAEGWGGDLLVLYSVSGGYAVSWDVEWDTPADAVEFYAAFNDVCSRAGGRLIDVGVWAIRGRYVAVRLCGTRVSILAAPELPAQWRRSGLLPGYIGAALHIEA